jgi:hypothetical protein
LPSDWDEVELVRDRWLGMDAKMLDDFAYAILIYGLMGSKIGSIPPERQKRLLHRFSKYLVRSPSQFGAFTPMMHTLIKPLPRFMPGVNPSKPGFTPVE